VWVTEASKCVKHVLDQLLWMYQSVPTSMEEEMHGSLYGEAEAHLKLLSTNSPNGGA